MKKSAVATFVLITCVVGGAQFAGTVANAVAAPAVAAPTPVFTAATDSSSAPVPPPVSASPPAKRPPRPVTSIPT